MNVTLEHKLRRFAASSHPLVATDYDGTLSSAKPDASGLRRPVPLAASAFSALALLPGVRTAIVSGRPADWLRRLSDELGLFWAAGDHGAICLDPAGWPVADWPVHSFTGNLLEARERALTVIASYPGLIYEQKTCSLAIDAGCVPEELRARALAAMVFWGLDCNDAGLQVLHGHSAVEVMPLGMGKLPALRRLAAMGCCDFTVYAGDDAPDEDAIRELSRRPDGIGIWIRSPDRPDPDFPCDCVLDGPEAWARLLDRLLTLRRERLHGSRPHRGRWLSQALRGLSERLQRLDQPGASPLGPLPGIA